MTTEAKRKALDEFCTNYDGTCVGCPLKNTNHNAWRTGCDPDEVSFAYSIAFPDTTPHIKDSGERREFATGAVRDIQEGKGRCDLMPLDVVAKYLSNETILLISKFQHAGDPDYLHAALANLEWDDPYTVILEVAKHFEEGAKKYGEYNWQKGIPVKCYIDSAVRHYLKFLRGDNDEPHDRAFVWNILCCIWTCIHKPELNDYRKEN